MPKIKITSNISIKLKEMTDELDHIIGNEVMKLYNDIDQKGRDVWKTGHFHGSIKAPVKIGHNWRIVLGAKYSSILWAGRDMIGGRAYGSENWAGGGEPMLQITSNNIIRRANNVSK